MVVHLRRLLLADRSFASNGNRLRLRLQHIASHRRVRDFLLLSDASERQFTNGIHRNVLVTYNFYRFDRSLGRMPMHLLML